MRKVLFVLLVALVGQVKGTVLIKDKLWPVGASLNVWFLDGEPFVHQLVASTATQWSRYGNIRLNFSNERPQHGSHIRISFKGYDGSSLGAHNDLTSDAPTMQLPSVADSKLSLEYKKRIILHEFGHALGFEHEFRHPHWPYGDAWLLYQAEQCQQLLAGYVAEDLQEVRCNKVNQTLSADTALVLPFDEHSIMNYPIAAEWLENREQDIEVAMTLSQWDKTAMTLAYPFTSGDDTQQLRFQNQCHEPVTVRWKGSVTSGISNSLNQITLSHLEQSNPVKISENDLLKFYAIDRSARYHWRSLDVSEPYIELQLNYLDRGDKRIALYCD